MPLWGKTDDANSAPKYLSEANDMPWSVDKDKAYFVDETEAQVDGNRDKGLKTPGWNLYHTYTDSDGATRHRVESLVAFKETANNAGDEGVAGNTDIEDSVVADS